MSLAKRLKELRKVKKISQRELAKILNISSGAVGMYETGKREMESTTLSRKKAILQRQIFSPMIFCLSLMQIIRRNTALAVSAYPEGNIKLVKAQLSTPIATEH